MGGGGREKSKVRKGHAEHRLQKPISPYIGSKMLGLEYVAILQRVQNAAIIIYITQTHYHCSVLHTHASPPILQHLYIVNIVTIYHYNS